MSLPVLSASSGSGRPGLFRDDRGVMMVIGMMFAFLWIGVAWVIYGIGNAIAYRENLQNAADAGAFAAAVYDARGMNILAMINIVMGIALAVLVSAKIIQALIFVAESAACQAKIAECSSWGWFAGICVEMEELTDCVDYCDTVDQARQTLQSIDSGVHDVLEVCHYLEVGLAVGWPWVAAGKTTSAGSYYGQSVPLVSSFAFSQIPWSADITLSELTGNIISFNGASNNDTNNTETRYGLPVSSDKYSHLCDVAILDATSLGGIVSGSLPGFLAGIVGEFGEWLCDAGADKNFFSEMVYEFWGIGDFGFPNVYFSGFTCAWAHGLASELPLSGPDIPDSKTTYSPMKLYDQAKMGLDYYGVWSTAIGVFSDTHTKIVQVAGQQAKHGNKIVAPLPDDYPLGVSKAEFYYDPRPSEVSQGSGAKKGETTIWQTEPVPIANAMWNMRWRARLRRYHYFPGILGQADQGLGSVMSLMSGGFSAVLQTVGKDILNGMSVDEILNSLLGPSVDVNKENNPPAEGIFH